MLVVPVVVTADRQVAWFLARGTDFCAEEVQLATLLLPGLRERLRDNAVDACPPETGDLTAREQEVLGLVAVGLTSRAIARRLEISERTVHKHLERIYRKTGCRGRVSVVLQLVGGRTGSRDSSTNPAGGEVEAPGFNDLVHGWRRPVVDLAGAGSIT